MLAAGLDAGMDEGVPGCARLGREGAGRSGGRSGEAEAEGAGAAWLGDAVGMVRGAAGTAPLSSTGPCARGVGDGEGLGGRRKSLTDCAATGAPGSIRSPRAGRKGLIRMGIGRVGSEGSVPDERR